MQQGSWRGVEESDEAPELITQILAVERHRSGYLVAQPSCRLDDVRVIWAGARLANRTSNHRTKMCLLVRRPSAVDLAEATDVVVVYLPNDLRMGDLVAIPSRAALLVEARPAKARSADVN